MMTLLKFTLSLILFICLAFSGNAQYYTFKNFTHQDGLLIGTTTSLLQASDGGIIIGTQGAGLVEYDGYSFKEVFSEENEIQFHVGRVETIHQQLYFPDPYKGIYRIDKNGKATSFFQKNGINGYNAIFELNGIYFIGHTKGILKVQGDDQKPLLEIIKEDKPFKITQRIEVTDGVILLTNHGNYHISKQGTQLTHLTNYLKSTHSLVKNATFGYFVNNELFLFDAKIQTQLSCQLVKHRTCKVIELKGDIPTKEVVSSVFNPVKNCFTVSEINGHLYELANGISNEIPFNFDGTISLVTQLISDVNGDYWMSSEGNGLLKVSLEPFTKLNFNDATKLKEIIFSMTTESGDLIISSAYNGTFVGKISSKNLTNFPFKIAAATYHRSKLYCATTNGIQIFDEQTKQFSPVQIPSNLKLSRLTLVFSDGINLWIGTVNQLIKLNLESNKFVSYSSSKLKASDFSYTAQLSFDKKHIYVGGNNGIFRYEIATDKVKRLDYNHLGYYAGLSIKDVFGTIWFTIEKGMVGITNENKIIELSDKRYFPSKLFYTLNSDNLGNLIIGTNKGINILKINEEGKVLNQATYDISCGFDGYETNMRSSSQVGNESLIGTIDGLYLVNPSLFQFMKPPVAPVIKTTSSHTDHQNGIVGFNIKSKNPKTKLIYYTYRIPSISEDWKPISTTSQFQEINLGSGEYLIEVKASYNGFIFSEISTLKIE